LVYDQPEKEVEMTVYALIYTVYNHCKIWETFVKRKFVKRFLEYVRNGKRFANFIL